MVLSGKDEKVVQLPPGEGVGLLVSGVIGEKPAGLVASPHFAHLRVPTKPAAQDPTVHKALSTISTGCTFHSESSWPSLNPGAC